MEKVRALIVDDSVVYRTQIRAALQLLNWIEVVATAANGYSALDQIDRHRPDLIILDLEMPGLSGIDTLKRMEQIPSRAKVIIFSSFSKQGAAVTLEALQAGACDFVPKPDGNREVKGLIGFSPAEQIRDLLLPKIVALFPYQAADGGVSLSPIKVPKSKSKFTPVIWDLFNPDMVVIGASTGGPTLIEKIFADLAGSSFKCPILIVQHMPPIFTASFAERLAKVTGVRVSEAQHGEPLEAGHIYIAPGDFHLRLNGKPGDVLAMLDQRAQVNGVRPAVDVLFKSAAEIYRDRCLGIVLTGMGHDGRSGAEYLKQNGGAIVIQDEQSCVVYGMPNAVYQLGAYDRIATPKEIVEILKDKVTVRPLRDFSKKVSGD